MMTTHGHQQARSIDHGRALTSARGSEAVLDKEADHDGGVSHLWSETDT